MGLLVVGIQAKHTFLVCSQKIPIWFRLTYRELQNLLVTLTNLNGQLGTTTPAGRAMKCSHNPGYYMLYVKDKT